jgi:general secretion pathway protein A
MYESFYGLKENPFDLHPDPEYLFMSSGHQLAYSHLIYAIVENKGFVIITGEIGSGKTTLLNYLLKEIPQDVTVGLINNTYLSPRDFLRSMCREFEVEFEEQDRSAVISRFHEFLLQQYSENKRVLLIIDEAQNLSPRTIEAIRMISNLEAEKNHLIQIVLVGQPELKEKLQRRDLQQFTQRVTVHCHLNALTHEEVEEYIKYRLTVGGLAEPDLFDAAAIEAIAEYSRGIPRLINILCDTSLVYGFADAREKINQQIIDNVMKERSASGIFLPDLIEDPIDAPRQDSTNGNGHINKRVEFLEQKIGRLEGVLEQLNTTIGKLNGKRDEKDAIIIELFKLLKSSLDSRFQVLKQVSTFPDKKNRDKADDGR